MSEAKKTLKFEELSEEQKKKVREQFLKAAKAEGDWFRAEGLTAAQIIEGGKAYREEMTKMQEKGGSYWSPLARKMYILGFIRGKHGNSSADKNIAR